MSAVTAAVESTVDEGLAAMSSMVAAIAHLDIKPGSSGEIDLLNRLWVGHSDKPPMTKFVDITTALIAELKSATTDPARSPAPEWIKEYVKDLAKYFAATYVLGLADPATLDLVAGTEFVVTLTGGTWPYPVNFGTVRKHLLAIFERALAHVEGVPVPVPPQSEDRGPDPIAPTDYPLLPGEAVTQAVATGLEMLGPTMTMLYGNLGYDGDIQPLHSKSSWEAIEAYIGTALDVMITQLSRPVTNEAESVSDEDFLAADLSTTYIASATTCVVARANLGKAVSLLMADLHVDVPVVEGAVTKGDVRRQTLATLTNVRKLLP